MAEASRGGQRFVVLGVLVVAGLLSLPLSAFLLDGQGTENLILPVALLAMASLGAVLGWFVPDVAGRSASQARGAAMGAVLGIGLSIAGVLLFWLLISGFGGA